MSVLIDSGIYPSVGKKVMSEVTRYRKFTNSLLGEKSDVVAKNIDTKKYVKFLLEEGSLEEKREIIGSFKNPITLSNKILKIL